MEKLEIAMKAIDKADETIISVGKLVKLMGELKAPPTLYEAINKSCMDLGKKIVEYNTLRELVR